MWDKNAYLEAYKLIRHTLKVFGKRVLVVDRYNVAKLYRKPLDDLRIKEMKRLKDELEPE